jgi:glycosyltransferase involved in cell wall biosynthesis
MPKVSVIVPVYKVEAYLPACLESIDNQTYRDFELILVDDASPDTCGAMCDDFAAQHPYARVLHQENMGLSEARNQGVKIAKGEYVTFIDSDDYVTHDYLEYLVMLIEKYETDVSAAKFVLFSDGKKPKFPEAVTFIDEKVPVPEALIRICYNKIPITAWGKLYKRELVEKYPYPKGQLYEDTATTYKIVGDVPAIAFGTKRIYCWRQRSGSITHAAITERHMYGITGAKEQVAYMKKRYPAAVPAAQARCVMKIIDLTYRLTLGKRDMGLFKRCREELKPLLLPLLKNKEASLSLKLRSVVLYTGFVPYWLLSKMYVSIRKNAKEV